MARSKKKIPYLSFEALKKQTDKRSISFFTRSGYVSSDLLNKKIFIYNGKRFNSFLVDERFIGLNLSEASLTRKRGKHKQER